MFMKEAEEKSTFKRYVAFKMESLFFAVRRLDMEAGASLRRFLSRVA
jgi:hypothetical protein